MSGQAGETRRPFRLAAITTTWHHRRNSPLPSHAQVILGRWLDPRPSDADWDWPGPRSTLASLYIEQLHPGDEIHDLAPRHKLPLVASIDEALTLGGDDLAVDGVMLLAEHGDYARNDVGQMLYPRKAMFDAIVATFKRCGRCVPVFCDKHFAYRFDWAREMVDTAERLGFTLFGGSSIPHCAMTPALPDPGTHPPAEIVSLYGDHVEDGGFHAMELAQSYAERRAGGETGVARVTAYRGEALAAARRDQAWSGSLESIGRETLGEKALGATLGTAFVIEHLDGLRVVLLFLEGFSGWGLAVRPASSAAGPIAARAVLGGAESNQGHFARLARVIEDGLMQDRPPFPVERTLLATGALAAAMQGLADPGHPKPTPELAIAYTAETPAA